MSSAPSAQPIPSDARWLAQALDPNSGLVRLIEMSPDAYRAASFLDDRMLHAPVVTQVRPFAEIAAAIPAEARSDARWIFHIGHVGSTLVSRLLGELDGVLALREPRILRDVALMPPALRGESIPVIQQLLSRTFTANQTALVKATSFVSEIAWQLVPPGERALFLYADPRTYIATILAGENSLRELHRLADFRAQRMSARVNGLALGDRAAHLAAAAWACEMTALEAAALAMADRQILWASFDELLEDMEVGMHRVAEFFGFQGSAARVGEIVRGPLMSRYSKSPNHEYSPALRRQLIDQELRLQGAEIEDALGMLQRAAEQSPLLAGALVRG